MQKKISPKEAAEKAGKWAASLEGRQTMEKILKEMKAAQRELNEKRKVPWQRMYIPITI